MFETQDLPLFGPLRTLGVPESLIDVFGPFCRVIMELGYDRSISPWEPAPERLIPTLNLVTVAADLVRAIGEGVNTALAITGSPTTVSIPASETANAYASERGTSRARVTDTGQATSQMQVIDTDQVKSATVSTSMPDKQADRPATHRLVVHGPFGAFGQRIRGLRHHGDADGS
jgi:PE-PPE domain